MSLIQNLANDYELKVIDVLKGPKSAEDDRIFIIPTLVRISPQPVKKVLGDISNEDMVLENLK